MAITIRIAATLRAYCHESRTELVLSAATVREALEELERCNPALYRGVCHETGTVRPHVHLFVNDAYIDDRQGLDTMLAPGDILSLMPAVSGG